MSKIRDPNGPNAGAVTWEGDLPAPLTTYVSTQYTGAHASRLQVQAWTNRTRSAVVQRRPRMNGIRNWYAHGAVMMNPNAARAASNGVTSSLYQRMWSGLFDWTQNLGWYAAGGYQQNLGYTFRMPQPHTNKTGGPTDSQMTQAPVFTGVQRVPRYSVVPKVYPTTGSKS